MGFKNSWMLMGDFSKTYQELGLNYATTANDAFGISASAMQTDNSVSKQQNLEAVYTRKVARWNLPEAQANIWFIGGLGSTTGIPLGSQKPWLLRVFKWITRPLAFIQWHQLGSMPHRGPRAISPPLVWAPPFMRWTTTNHNSGW